LPGVGDPLEQVDGNEGFAGARGQSQQGTLGPAGHFALGDLFHDGADRRILVVATGAFAAGIPLHERSGRRGIQRVALAFFIAGAEQGWCRECGDRHRCGGQTGETVELDELVAVG